MGLCGFFLLFVTFSCFSLGAALYYVVFSCFLKFFLAFRWALHGIMLFFLVFCTQGKLHWTSGFMTCAVLCCSGVVVAASAPIVDPVRCEEWRAMVANPQNWGGHND